MNRWIELGEERAGGFDRASDIVYISTRFSLKVCSFLLTTILMSLLFEIDARIAFLQRWWGLETDYEVLMYC